MGNKTLSVLSTKVLPTEFMMEAEMSGVHIECIPFIEIQGRTDIDKAMKVFKIHRDLIFTSENAVSAILGDNQMYSGGDKTVYCVGKKVAEHFPNCNIYQKKNAAELGELLLQKQVRNAVYFRGNRSLEVIPNILDEASVPFQSFTVYDTKLLSPIVENHYDFIWFFSPSGVESYLTGNKLPKQTTAVAIGPTTAAALSNYDCLISEETDIKSLLKTTITHATTNANL